MKEILDSLRAPLASFISVTFVWAWALWCFPYSLQLPLSSVFTQMFLFMGQSAPILGALSAWDLLGRWPTWGIVFRPPSNLRLAGVAVGVVPAVVICSSIFLGNAIFQDEDPKHSFDVLLAGTYAIPLRACRPISFATSFIQELGWRVFLFAHLSLPRGGMGHCNISNGLSSIVCGFVYWLWHLPLVGNQQFCCGKYEIYFTAFLCFSFTFNHYITACFKLLGFSALGSAYGHALISSTFMYVEEKLPSIREEIVLISVSIALAGLGVLFSPPLRKRDGLVPKSRSRMDGWSNNVNSQGNEESHLNSPKINV